MDPSQRDILLDAILLELSRKGYSELSVRDVLKVTGVSQGEFEREFGEKDVALFAAYEKLSERVVNRALEACREDEAWPERIRLGLQAVLELLATEPDMARALTRSFPGIRPSTYDCYVELLASFVPALHAGRDYAGVDEELPERVELLAVGAAESLIFLEVEAGRTERLPAMLPEILFSMLVPFIGPKRATEEMHSAAATP